MAIAVSVPAEGTLVATATMATAAMCAMAMMPAAINTNTAAAEANLVATSAPTVMDIAASAAAEYT